MSGVECTLGQAKSPYRRLSHIRQLEVRVTDWFIRAWRQHGTHEHTTPTPAQHAHAHILSMLWSNKPTEMRCVMLGDKNGIHSSWFQTTNKSRLPRTDLYCAQSQPE